MFPEFTVKHDLGRLADQVRTLMPRQVEFASALALTWTARDGKVAVEKEMGTVFDRPTPFTMRGFRLFPATRARLEARVVFRHDLSRDYLGPQIMGGDRALKAFERSLERVGILPRGFQALPGQGAQVDQYGNMARSQIVQLLSYFQSFSEQGYRANMTAKRKASLAKVGRTAGGSKTIGGVEYFVVSKTKAVRGRQQTLQEGIWSRTGVHGSDIRPIIIFVRRTRYQRRLRFFEVMEETIRDRLHPNWYAAWQRAQATARP